MARTRGRSRPTLRLSGVGAAVAGMLVLSGCATPGAADPAQSTAAAARTTGPLDEFFGGPAGPQSEEEMAAKERQVQELIVACMAVEGFEYRPYVPVPPDDEFFTEWGTRAFAEKYGYGYSNSPYNEQTMDADPNQAIVEAMSPSEQEAYYAALHGEQVFAEGDPADGGEPVLPEDLGCWGQAQQEVFGVGPASGEFDDLFNRWFELREKAEADPTVVEAEQRWASCMSDAGHPGYSDVNAPMEEISKRVDEYYTTHFPEPTESPSVETTPAESWTPPPPDDPELLTIQRDEITVAVADFDCREQVGYQAAFDAANLELEEQFVRDNRAELERYRDLVDAGGG